MASAAERPKPTAIRPRLAHIFSASVPSAAAVVKARHTAPGEGSKKVFHQPAEAPYHHKRRTDSGNKAPLISIFQAVSFISCVNSHQ